MLTTKAYVDAQGPCGSNLLNPNWLKDGHTESLGNPVTGTSDLDF